MQSFSLTGTAVRGVDTHFYAPQHLAALPTKVKLGKRPPRIEPEVLKLSNYLKPGYNYTIPKLPIDYAAAAMASFQHMYLNDTYGCCVIASAFHQVGLWTGNESGQPIVGADNEVLKIYRIWNPGNQDNGCVIADVLDYTRDHGVPLNGIIHKIDGYVSIDWTNWDEVLVALHIFGSLKLGVNLPDAWLNNAVWDITDTQIVGGHDIPTVKAESDSITISSWARLYKITKAAFISRRYIDECWCPLSPDWYAKANKAPNVISAADLKSDLEKLRQGQIPDIGPGPGPIPLLYVNLPHVPKNGMLPLIRTKVDIPKGKYALIPADQIKYLDHDIE